MYSPKSIEHDVFALDNIAGIRATYVLLIGIRVIDDRWAIRSIRYDHLRGNISYNPSSHRYIS
uniref:BrnT family toxin n=1 Tax=Ascaris lumbricoides TaxID=6252 RepID=A0A0M3IN24_ASCLU